MRKVLFGLVVAVVLVLMVWFAIGHDARKTQEVPDEDASEQTAASPPPELTPDEYYFYRDKLTELVKTDGPRVALDTFRNLMDAHPAVLNSCHPLAHDLGHATYELTSDFGEAMRHWDEVCNSGFIHGIIEWHFSEIPDILAALPAVCADYPADTYDSWQCHHGVGHGIMFYTENDLPRSLELCDIYDADLARVSCYNGVFMENFNSDQKVHVSEYVPDGNGFAPCGTLAPQYQATCYAYVPTWWLAHHEYDFAGALTWCRGAPAHPEQCAAGVGSEALKRQINTPAATVALCEQSHPSIRAACAAGAASQHYYHYSSPAGTRELCDTMNGDLAAACYHELERILEQFPPGE